MRTARWPVARERLLMFTVACLACGGLIQSSKAPSVKKDEGKPKLVTHALAVSLEKWSTLGKTPNEVIKAVGKPDSTISGAANNDINSPEYDGIFQYREKQIRVIDPATDKARARGLHSVFQKRQKSG